MKTEVAIIGGGPGGSTSAMYLLREGINPIIIEKDTFPRYHIGESMTGECGGVVRDLGLGEKMLKRNHPIKQGVKVFGKHSWWVPVMARDGQGNLADQFTWQVRRSDFDKMMLDEAVSRGATLIHGQATKPLLNEDGSVRGIQVWTKDGKQLEIESEVLLDCSGQSTFLANQGVTGPKYLGSYDKQIAIFSQVVGGIRDNGDSRDLAKDNTLIFYKSKYHWAWWIPIDDEVVSVGVVSPAAYFLEQNESKRDYLTRELGELHPELSRRLPDIKLVEEARAIKNYSYQVKRFCGKGYVCIGDAHRFIDPIFSFGLYVTMKESQIAAPVIKAYLEGKNREQKNPFGEYQVYCEKGIDILEDALDGFWEHPFAFAYFVHNRYREFMIDVFAGRIYEGQPSPALEGFRQLLKRERMYDDDIYSIPIGSRYHPERAAIWRSEPDDLISLLPEMSV
jgi:1H-pyrrole-2-carbonyl-[peptidyl-carrier protein] brominase